MPRWAPSTPSATIFTRPSVATPVHLMVQGLAELGPRDVHGDQELIDLEQRGDHEPALDLPHGRPVNLRVRREALLRQVSGGPKRPQSLDNMFSLDGRAWHASEPNGSMHNGPRLIVRGTFARVRLDR
jgi:hypothetical protein